MRRDNVKGGVYGLDLRQRVLDAAVAEHLFGVAHFYNDVVTAVLVGIRNAGDEVGETKIFCKDSYLEGEEIDALVLHGVCDHVVGDDGGVKPISAKQLEVRRAP